MQLLEYIKIETWDVNPDEKLNSILESSDIQGYNNFSWLTHPEYFYQVTVEDYEIEQFVKEQETV